MFFRYLQGILTRLADFRPFLTLVNFYQKIGFFAFFVLKTPIMYERKYKNKLGGNISILCEALAPYDALAMAPCVVCQWGSPISYKSALNFTIVN